GVMAGGDVQRALVLLRLGLGARAEAVDRAARVERVRLAGGAAADRDVLEAAVGGAGDRLRREHLLVAAQADAARVLLVPDEPRHGVRLAGEREVGLDAVAGRVDVQRRVAGRRRGRRRRVQALDAGLLPAERADARAPARRVGRAVGLLDPARGEDLVLGGVVGGGAVLLLPGDPRDRVVARDGRAADERRVLGGAVGVDVQRRDAVAGRAVLALGDPHVRGRVESAGEDVRLPAGEVRVRLVPRGPRDLAAGAGEVDRRRLGLLVRLDVERLALGDPAPVLEGADEDLLRGAGLLLERRPRDVRGAGDEGAADDVGHAGILVGIDADRGVVVDLGAVGGQTDDGGRRGAREREHDDEDRRRKAPAVEQPGHEASCEVEYGLGTATPKDAA